MIEGPLLNDSHLALAEKVRTWAEAHTKNLTEQDCRNFVSKLGSAGLLEHATASPLNVTNLCIIREVLAEHSGLADFCFAMQGLGSAPINLFGSDELKKAFLEPTKAGKKIAAFALSEKEAGSDVSAIATIAVADGSNYVINGEKTWISNGGIADYYVVFARVNPEAEERTKLGAFVVPASDPGLRCTEQLELASPHPLGTIRLEDCRGELLGEPEKGFRIALTVLDIFRSTVGAAALGLARRAFNETTQHCQQRALFGKTLADFQLTQAKLATMATEIDASALLIYRAAWMKDNGSERITKESAMAKLYATEAAQRIIDQSVQLFGGQGVLRDHIVERLYRDIRPLRIYEGASEIQQLVIARELLENRT